MEITVLDKNTLNKVFVLDSFDSVIWVDRYYGYGDFELHVDPNSKILTYLAQDNYLIIKESEHVMVVESINLKTDIETGTIFIISGRSLETILYRRIIWKQTVLSGNLQDAIVGILNDNVISPIDPERKINNFIVELSDDPAITSLTTEGQLVAGEYVYEVIQNICESNGIGFKITLNEDKNFVFSLYSGKNRTFDQILNPFVAFSPDLDNLQDSDYFHSSSTLKNVTLIGGEGEGSDRILVPFSLTPETPTDLDRREMFTEAGDISTFVDGAVISPEEYYGQLALRGFFDLIQNQQISSFDGTIDPNTNYKFGIDFYIGDIVQISNQYGIKGKSRIIEYMYSEDSSGINTYPTFQLVE